MIEIKQGDFRVLSNDIKPGTVDAIVTDPPYPRKYLSLWGDLGRVAARLLKPGGFLVAYSGSMFFPEVIEQVCQSLNWFWLFHLLHEGDEWCKIKGHEVLQEAKPVPVWVKGRRTRGVRWASNVIRSGGKDKRYHHWGQSLEGVQRLVELFTDPGDLVYEPFLGGGTTLEACVNTGRNGIGHDSDPEAIRISRERLGQASGAPCVTVAGLSRDGIRSATGEFVPVARLGGGLRLSFHNDGHRQSVTRQIRRFADGNSQWATVLQQL